MTPKFTKMALFAMMMVVCPFLGLIAGCSSNSSDTVSFVILQTSDVHHHAAGFGPQSDYTPLDTSDNDSVKGGYARLAALIKGIRSEAASMGRKVLLFDSGDFLMGTIYDLAAADPIAFKYLQSLEYDAVTLGNHEFDWGIQGLYNLINAAGISGFEVPIVASNMIIDSQDSEDDEIEALIANNTIVDSKIITVSNDVKVGVLGIMGLGAYSAAPLTAPITFNQDFAFLQAKVDALKASGANIIVLLSHTGVLRDGTGEDVDIAENVTGIDIIASGHTHNAMTTELIKGASNSIIFSPGEYGSYLSRLEITFNKKQKKIVAHDFELLPVDDTVPGDEAMDDIVKGYQPVIDAALDNIGVSAETVVSRAGFDLEKEAFQETGFGNLAADAIRAAASDLGVESPGSYDLGVIASGVIRDNLYQGKTGDIIFSDVYNALPLGISPHDASSPGYPLMSIYVTAAEIRNICEISVSGAPLMGEDYYLNLSGIRYDYNPSGTLLSRVANVYLCDPSDMNTETSGALLNLADTATLYRVAVNLYALSMMDLATTLNLPVVPKDQNGDPISSADYANFRIDISPDAGVQELKEWMALNYFLEEYYPSSGEGIPAAIYGDNGTGLGRANAVGTE